MKRRIYKHELMGQRFGRLVVTGESEERRNGKVMWDCICDCGTRCKVRSCHLVNGHTKSCGCYSSEKTTEMNTTHGETHTRLHSIWASMKTRCNNPNSKSYAYYGGRGIRVCKLWEDSFEEFRDWALSNGYADDLTLDRKEVNGNYEPCNCHWATWHEQRVNQRR